MHIAKSFLAVVFLITTGCAQNTIEKNLSSLNRGTVPYIYAEKLNPKKVTLLDSRKKEEFDVSHLKGAMWVGHKKFRIDSVLKHLPDKDQTVVVYCSIGVRSEDIGEKLMKAGFTDVQNLYGGIFEWKNKGYPVYNLKGRETDSVHAYSKKWGKLLTTGIKVYEHRNKE
ncbi:MAG: rhodanese-like domain-containing protein [Eudoraea sp.]|nr:rhodanese-like domain-containing protein [Eudoraea sp.]